MAPVDRYRLPVDAPSRIPIFPLRGVILLPRATLPLNIFEPRYLAMIEDVMSGSRVLGLIQPDRSSSDDESPPGKSVGLRRVGCAGRITSYQELDDGRFLVTLTGIARFTLVGEVLSAKPYRTFGVSYDGFVSDFSSGTGADGVDRDGLLGVLKTYLEAREFRADWNAIVNAPSEFLVNSLSIICPYGPEEKQALLEAADLKTRAEILMTLAEMELASGDSGAGSTLQ